MPLRAKSMPAWPWVAYMVVMLILFAVAMLSEH